MNKLLQPSCVAFVICMACGPMDGAESATDARSSDASSGGPGTAAPESTGDSAPTEGGTSTGESIQTNAECPDGQAPLSALWTAAGETTLWDDGLELGDTLVALADGRLAVVAMSRAEPLKSAAALVFLSATGEPLETHRGAFTDRGFEAYTVAVDEADQPVVLSMTSHDGSSKRTLLSRFASDGAVLGEVELEFPEGRGALALAEVPVVAGFDLETEKL